MKELSICIRTFDYELNELYEALSPLFNSDKTELLIMNSNKLSDDFNELCFSHAQGKKLLIINGDFQIDSSFVNDIVYNSYIQTAGNVSYELRHYISPSKPIYYTTKEKLIFDRLDSTINMESSIIINDFTPINENYFENYLGSLLNSKAYTELYLWYKYFVSKGSNSVKNKFNLLLTDKNMISFKVFSSTEDF